MAAVGEWQQRQVRENYEELDQLNDGHVLLPPDVLLVGWPHGRHHVVGVHDHVYRGVDNAHDATLFAGGVLEEHPREVHGHRVVVDMQERRLAVFLAEDEDYGVNEFGHLGDVVPPR